MSVHDDPRKKATPPAKPHTASYKQGSKNSINKEGGKVCRKNALFQNNSHKANPLDYLIDSEAKPRQKKEHKVDPFMIRQAKLAAAKAAK